MKCKILYLPDDGKRKKAVVQQAIAMPQIRPYGGFDKIKAAVPYALDKGVTPIRRHGGFRREPP